MRTARRNLHQDGFLTAKVAVLGRHALAFIPVQRPGSARQNENDLSLADVIVVPAHASRTSRCQVQVGDISQYLERARRQCEAQAADISSIL